MAVIHWISKPSLLLLNSTGFAFFLFRLGYLHQLASACLVKASCPHNQVQIQRNVQVVHANGMVPFP
uniref:Uncharacterized protein n=1 Tax=Cyanistes caeruleus TaxID=156563 RepID=A0A8C0UXI4_CYACU